METISKAGEAWLAAGGIPLTDVRVTSLWAGRFGCHVTFSRDPARPWRSGSYRDSLFDREGRWLLRTEVGAAKYEEYRSGHALLVCRSAVLPADVCTGLYRSAFPLADVLVLPKGTPIAFGDPRVIRAEAKRGATHLLLRVGRVDLPEQRLPQAEG